MTIDLHTHSSKSDGTDSPTELINNAVAAGLEIVALTDHDSTEGWVEAQSAAKRAGIQLVKGIEVSTRCDGVSVHLLGYDFDPKNKPLLTELGKVLDGRNSRLPAILERLRGLGIDIDVKDVRRHSTNAAASGRPHVADAMVELGVVSSRDEAFAHYLTPGKPAYVDRYAAPLDHAIALINAAGGKTVLAHPWSRGSKRVLTKSRIASLKEIGLDGLEVDHNDHGEEDRAHLGQIVRELDLVRTGSSDYHGTGKVGFDLGCNTTAYDEFHRLFS
ncbi:putative metal-dependent phosphoesterase TrpH [Aeromicrobium panaciterrae]|uniref:Metal-dependent phosphoesterase TrpH n=1 Tax=Aeromicrobium panaciterrae TaxID=363861 RepID=A0ABU1UMA9_9ACTN|nr:PHP domain-containing protein [Aeromicrobium panaciterrae]MDR7086270.1 putative metal-dependent phosphoesterase TrpH [Aeromicrobium panaciterrae]